MKKLFLFLPCIVACSWVSAFIGSPSMFRISDSFPIIEAALNIDVEDSLLEVSECDAMRTQSDENDSNTCGFSSQVNQAQVAESLKACFNAQPHCAQDELQQVKSHLEHAFHHIDKWAKIIVCEEVMKQPYRQRYEQEMRKNLAKEIAQGFLDVRGQCVIIINDNNGATNNAYRRCDAQVKNNLLAEHAHYEKVRKAAEKIKNAVPLLICIILKIRYSMTDSDLYERLDAISCVRGIDQSYHMLLAILKSNIKQLLDELDTRV